MLITYNYHCKMFPMKVQFVMYSINLMVPPHPFLPGTNSAPMIKIHLIVPVTELLLYCRLGCNCGSIWYYNYPVLESARIQSQAGFILSFSNVSTGH